MLSFRASLAFLLVAAIFATPAIAADTTHHTSATHSTTHKKTTTHKSKKKAKKTRGQQAIDSTRVLEIQQALIREHYLNGEANGQWDTSTLSAMQKFQADQGWQTKLMPDSRALKKLGLGPDYSGAINASESSFSDPQPASSIPAGQAAGFTAASGVNR
jgi:peptidoglycan hydrolase-like protein with peptidoglycan-binding domain